MDKITWQRRLAPCTLRVRYLKKNGFVEVRQNGSHVKMNNPSTKRTVIVPVHAKSMKRGLEQAILKQAGLKLP